MKDFIVLNVGFGDYVRGNKLKLFYLSIRRSFTLRNMGLLFYLKAFLVY